MAVPVCSWMTACGWAGVSVCRPRRKQSLSTCRARCGNSSETQVPVWPCWLNLNFEAVSVPPPGPTLPSSFCSCGLYSQVSICDIAPSMNRKMIRLAFAGKCGGFGASGSRRAGCAAARRRRSGRAARPGPGSRTRRWRTCSTCRRDSPVTARMSADSDMRSGFLSFGSDRTLLQVAKLGRAEQRLAEADPGGASWRPSAGSTSSAIGSPVWSTSSRIGRRRLSALALGDDRRLAATAGEFGSRHAASYSAEERSAPARLPSSVGGAAQRQPIGRSGFAPRRRVLPREQSLGQRQRLAAARTGSFSR